MKYLKLFEGHINEEEVAEICKEFGIKNWTLNSDGTIDVNGDLIITKQIKKLPLKFGRVEGNFWCSNNKLTSLIGCPKYVGWSFSCNYNKLISLEGCPEYIGGDFNCSFNNIKNFERIGYCKHFYCWGNPIELLWVLFDDASKIEMFNEWSIIQGDNVILYRLNDFLQEIGEKEISNVKLNLIKTHYKVI